MSRNSNSRSSTPRKGGSLLAGILIGMVLGVAIAGWVAWYILKTPNPFANICALFANLSFNVSIVHSPSPIGFSGIKCFSTHS